MTFVFCLGQEWHPDFKLIGECDRSMLFSGALSLQHGNVIFKWILTCSFLFTIILQAADGHACFQKGELCSELLCVLFGRSVK